MYDELQLDTLGDKKTALFLIMSDTDSTFNFLISMVYTQLFNLLCDKADDVYGGKLPIHVRCLIDECANIGQIPNLEKLVATIRSREISACLVLQAKSQLKAIYKDNADTIIGNMDSRIFLGGSEPGTLKDLSEMLGKETIDAYNTSDTRGNSPSYGTNYSKLGHELLSRDELAVLDGGKCILQLRGVRPFLSDKYDLTQHPNYKLTSDFDEKNRFDIEKYLNRKTEMDGESKFRFEWNDLVKSGLSVKDAIAPTAFAFKNSRTFQMGGIYCAASFLSITASDISDQLLKDFLDMDSSQIVTMHIQSVDQNRAIKTVKRTITELDRSKIEEQKKAIRAGYDIDIIPSDLATYGRDAKALLKELQSQNERMFLVTFLVLNTGRTEQELENNVFQASSIAQKHNCNLCRLDYQQEQGLMSSLPLADNQIEIQRGLTTSSTAIFIPFTTQELYQAGKESLYYGLNALSNNLIMVDRKKLKNPNGLILGTPGSGKSFSAKREIANAFLVTDDDIIINDPEGEYSPLVNRLKGQVIKISPNSTQFINPMDINANYSEEDNPLSLKADFILSLCELVVGGKEGLLPVEKTVIDRCVHLIYRKYFADPCPENMPILEDLYNALLQQDEKEAHHVATALEIYVKGSLNLFNHRTNVNVNNRIVCYDIKELGKQMKKLGMLIVQDQVWGRVTANRSSGKSTRYYMDEMHLLLKEEQTAAYSVEIWKRFRKWGGVPTGLTQNVKDLLSSREVENIFENSDMIIMLNQAAGDRQILAKQLNISPHQLSYVTHSGEGEGLLFFGNVILPFVDRFPTDLELYRIMTTKLGEVSEGKKE